MNAAANIFKAAIQPVASSSNQMITETNGDRSNASWRGRGRGRGMTSTRNMEGSSVEGQGDERSSQRRGRSNGIVLGDKVSEYCWTQIIARKFV